MPLFIMWDIRDCLGKDGGDLCWACLHTWPANIFFPSRPGRGWQGRQGSFPFYETPLPPGLPPHLVPPLPSPNTLPGRRTAIDLPGPTLTYCATFPQKPIHCLVVPLATSLWFATAAVLAYGRFCLCTPYYGRGRLGACTVLHAGARGPRAWKARCAALPLFPPT